jgi:hypothetical protein
VLILSMFPTLARGGILLMEGNRYEFGFDSLAVIGPDTGVNQAGFTAYLGGNALDAGEDVRVQLYSDAFTDPAFFLHDFTTPTITDFAATVVNATAWQDLQGKLAFTMIAGSLELDRLQARVVRGGQLYEGDVLSAVPEPSAVSLTFLGALLFVVWAVWRRSLSLDVRRL